MNLWETASNRVKLSRMFMRMARHFDSGDLQISSDPCGPADDGRLLAAQYRNYALRARWSARQLRKLARS